MRAALMAALVRGERLMPVIVRDLAAFAKAVLSMTVVSMLLA